MSSNYVYGSLENRRQIAASILAGIPALGVQTLDEATFMTYLQNMFFATPPTHDKMAILRWSCISGLQYFTRQNTYRMRRLAAVNPNAPSAPRVQQEFNEFQSMDLLTDLEAPRDIVFVPKSIVGSRTAAHNQERTDSHFVSNRMIRSVTHPTDVYENIREGALLVLPDFHQLWHQPPQLRGLKETIMALEDSNQKIVLVFPPGTDVPMELQSLMYVENFDSPNVHEFERLIYFWLEEQADLTNNNARDDFFRRTGVQVNDLVSENHRTITGWLDPSSRVQDTRGNLIWTPESAATEITRLSQAVTGLNWEETKHTLTRAYQTSEILCVSDVQQSKITYLNSHPALEVYPPSDLPGFADVGGYQAIKDYISQHMAMFRPENKQRARELGVPYFKGCLLLGVPGTGKSLLAKATGHESNMLVCGLDLGNVMNKFVGGSEANIKQVTGIMEKAAGEDGLVVFMDEIEKQLAGSANAGASDAGATSRVHRAFLTWLQECKYPVIKFMTANNIDQLPPEFLRPGRIDAVFFFDLPGPAARLSILNVHLGRFPSIPIEIDVEHTANVTLRKFTGAEIEQMVKECSVAFLHGTATSINDILIAEVCRTLKLQADTHATQIEQLRARAAEFRLADEEPYDYDTNEASTGSQRVSSLRRTTVEAVEFDADSPVEI